MDDLWPQGIRGTTTLVMAQPQATLALGSRDRLTMNGTGVKGERGNSKAFYYRNSLKANYDT